MSNEHSVRLAQISLTAAIGDVAKQIFERAQLPNEVLGRIWTLADTEQKGQLGLTDFIVAMHLLASYRNGSLRALPQTLPAGLYEAAARRGIPRQTTGSRSEAPPPIPRQFSGSNYPRTSSPLAGPPSARNPSVDLARGDDWAISPQDKTQFDQIFASVDTSKKGYVTGEEAVGFFSNSRLPEEVLAQIWDLADINSEGQLNRDEFAVAMYLIRQQRAKADGRGVLPQSLPPNLVPPSMRNRNTAPAQPTAPVFDNAANTTVSKSAADDLFGLDAAPSPAAPNSQITPDRSVFTSSPPPGASSGSSRTAQQSTRTGQAPQSAFKPFIPSSSFGQSILQPQMTGQSQSSPRQPEAPRPVQSTNDDLLGDNDPEVSKKLTQETSELANLSNQVSSLTNQMQEVKSKRISTEQDLSRAFSQKRDFESRLAQLRTAYEQEVAEVRTLEDRLSKSKTETAQLQRDFAMLDGTHQDIQNQHRRLTEAMDTDQAENTSLREKIRQVNAQIGTLKTQLEKLRLDAKKQQGLVAINKKQLSTNEGEREKVQQEIDDVSKASATPLAPVQEGTDSRSTRSPETADSQGMTSPPALPRTGSTTSMNPFFRQNTTNSSVAGPASPFENRNVTSPGTNTFDSLFGPSAVDQDSAPRPPPTTFGSDSPTSPQLQESAPLPRITDLSRQGTGPPSGLSTPSASEPPPPPQSRQITSSFLPLRDPLERTDSTTSSVKVIPPASRLGSHAFDSPADRAPASDDTFNSTTKGLHISDEPGYPPQAQASPVPAGLQHTPPSSDEGETQWQESAPSLEPAQPLPDRKTSQDIPGAFPGDATPPAQQEPPYKSMEPSRSDTSQGQHPSHLPQAGSSDNAPAQSPPKEDFDSMFQGFTSNDNPGNDPVIPKETSSADVSKKFPGIQEFGDDDDSDSDVEHGFDDDFTTTSPRRQPAKEGGRGIEDTNNKPSFENGSLDLPKRPFMPTSVSNTSQLPTPGAQQSPPTYDQSIPSPMNGHADQRSASNSFPAEFSGLLPSREDPTSPPPNSLPSGTASILASEDKGKQPEILPGPLPARGDLTAQASDTAFPSIQQPPNVPRKTPFDDFDNDFADLSEAKEATEEDADPPGTVSSRGQNGFDEFNPTFDSPTPSRTTVQPGSSTFSADNSATFQDFESSKNQGFGSTSHHPTNSSFQDSSRGEQGMGQMHDWDAMFAGLDTPQNSGVTSTPPSDLLSSKEAPKGTASGTGNTTSPLKTLDVPSRPDTLQRSPTADDDPILKDLTSMGYPREEALQALEKYDYNLDVVSLGETSSGDLS